MEGREANRTDAPHAAADGDNTIRDEFAYPCPNCATHVDPPADAPASGLLQCPVCGEQFFVPTLDDGGDEDAAAYRAVEEKHLNREQALNELRIRQIVTLRRSLYRTRGYLVAATATCAVVALQLGWKAFAHARATDGIGVRPLAYALATVGIPWLAAHFYRRIRILDRELAKPVLDEPTAPPDFSTLSDGSYLWKNLERFAESPGDEPPDAANADPPGTQNA